MHLYRQWLTGEEKLEQERGGRSICAGTLIPQLADCGAIAARLRPRAWISNAPGFGYGACGYMLNRHENHPAAGTEKSLPRNLIVTFFQPALSLRPCQLSSGRASPASPMSSASRISAYESRDCLFADLLP